VLAGLDISVQNHMCEKPETCAWMVQWHSERRQQEEEDSVAAQKSSEHEKHYDALEAMHRVPWAEVQDVLQKYCLAVAAKDCSIMLSYSAQSEDGQVEPTGAIPEHVMDCRACKHDATKLLNVLNPSQHRGDTCLREQALIHTCVDSIRMDGQLIRYRLGVVDMDRKSTGKVESRHELEQNILQCWKRMSSSDGSSGTSAKFG
jgi:hypothetical protein